jgi:hypothetical protein
MTEDGKGSKIAGQVEALHMALIRGPQRLPAHGDASEMLHCNGSLVEYSNK